MEVSTEKIREGLTVESYAEAMAYTQVRVHKSHTRDQALPHPAHTLGLQCPEKEPYSPQKSFVSATKSKSWGRIYDAEQVVSLPSFLPSFVCFCLPKQGFSV